MKRLLITIAVSLAGCAHAEFMNGNMLLSRMNGDWSDKTYALGYVAGVADALHGIIFCPPVGFTVGQLSDMTKIYLDRNPQDRHMSADSFVRAALLNFPCKKEKKGNDV